MSDEMTQESQSVQTETQSTGIVSGESQEAQNVESTGQEQTTPVPSESDTHDTQEKGNEGVEESLSADMTEKERSAVRKMHEATQQAAQYKKEADAFQQLLHHPEFNEFLQWRQQKQNPASAQPPAEIPQVQLSDEEFLEAQSNPKKFEGLLNSRLQAMLNPIAQQAIQKINNLERELAVSKHEREIDAFATKHPDFWEIDPRIMKTALTETKGQGLESAYNTAKQLEKQYLEKAQNSIQKKVAEKKQASSASPSRSVEPKVIYVENESEATRVAYENAVLGKRVDVRVKKNKK
jgi:hypothetical protein